MSQLHDKLRLAEAVAYGLIFLPLGWAMRYIGGRVDNMETGLGETGIPWRWGAFLAALLFACVTAYALPRAHNWLSGSTALTGIGLVWGIGINGSHPLMVPGTYWDIEVLWLYMNGSIAASNAHYGHWVSIASLSGSGLGLACLGLVAALCFGENPVRELRAGRKHRGSNRYRSRETVFGDANWSDWSRIKPIVGHAQGIVLGEAYDPRRNRKAFIATDKSTWGEGGKAELVTLNTGFQGGHSLVFAGTGAGKTAGIVFPTALTYRHPIIFMDPQHEIYETVAGARADMGFKARVIDIGKGVDLIALLRPWLNQSGIGYMHLADSLVGKADARKSEYAEFYATEGANLVSGLLEYGVLKNVNGVFTALYRSVAVPEEEFKESITALAADPELPDTVKTRLASYAETEGKLFSNLQTNLKQALNWGAFPEMAEVLESDAPGAPPLLGPNTDVYIRLSVSNLTSFPGLVRSILGAILYCVNESRDGLERLMIVDEAYQIGRLQGFELIRDTMRKRGLHLMLIFQSAGQLEELYGKAGVRAWNNSVAARVYGTSDDEQDAGILSRMIGEYTVDVEGRSRSSGLRGMGFGTPSENVSKSTSLQRASLMRPEQLRTLPDDGLIIFYKGQSPLICGKAFSFRRPEWQNVTPFRAPGGAPVETVQDRFDRLLRKNRTP